MGLVLFVSLGKYLSLIVEISSGNLRISACRTAERSERMSFVSLARSASVPPPTGVALVTTALSQRSGSGSGTSEVVIEERRRR